MTLEGIVSRLEARQVELESQLSTRVLTDEELVDILGFAKAISEELEGQEDTFETRESVIELLNVTATLSIEDNHKILEAHCVLGPARFVNSGDHFSK